MPVIANTLFTGKVFLQFTTLPSTNQYALDLITKNKPSEGTAISTDFQTAGRGQIGSSWQSNPGQNLLLSVILYPKWLSPNHQFSLSQAVALAVADTVALVTEQAAEVKWPNDVYLNGKKVAGILIQNSLVGRRMQWSVAGIGFNVNEATFPEALPLAYSLRMATDQAHNLSEVKTLLFQQLERRYLQLKANPTSINEDYLAALFQYQSWHNYRIVSTNEVFEGRITGIATNGALLIEGRRGKTHSFSLKEVVFLKD